MMALRRVQTAQGWKESLDAICSNLCINREWNGNVTHDIAFFLRAFFLEFVVVDLDKKRK
jgi:hypothetical protein